MKTNAMVPIDVPNTSAAHSTEFFVSVSYPGYSSAIEEALISAAWEFRGVLGNAVFTGRQFVHFCFKTYIEALAFVDLIPSVNNKARFHSLFFLPDTDEKINAMVQLDPQVRMVDSNVFEEV